MYFKDRTDAAHQLAQRMQRYKGAGAVVMALSDGAVALGRVLADQLEAGLTLLLSRDITLPGEISVLGTVDQSGGFTYNNMFSTGELEEYVGEFHNYIESEKMNKTSEINHLLGNAGILDRSALRDKVLIVLSDGAKYGISYDAAMNYLKPVRLKRLIAAAPLASVAAVDRMHIIADEIQVLSVVDNYLDTSHYYENNETLETNRLLSLLTTVEPDERLAQPDGRTYT